MGHYQTQFLARLDVTNTMVETMETNGIEPHVQKFEHFEQGAKQPAWVFPLRKAGIARFAELGFPTLKQEDWRFTNVGGKIHFWQSPRRPAGFRQRSLSGRAFHPRIFAPGGRGSEPRLSARDELRLARKAFGPLCANREQRFHRAEHCVLSGRRFCLCAGRYHH